MICRTGPVLMGQELSHAFGTGPTRALALDDVSLEVEAGEFVLLMGPSGSGKSTLLSVLSGLLRPARGTVQFHRQDLWALSEWQREQLRLKHFGFVFQGHNLFPALTARQQLELVLRWGEGVSRREAGRRADAMLDLLGLGRKGKLRPAQLSGGEKQRVAIGRALIKEPAICFADEPTSALDWGHGEQVVELLRTAAHERGSSVVVVSHDARVVDYADRVVYLEDGRLREAEERSVVFART